MSQRVEWATAASGVCLITKDDDFSDAFGSTVKDHALVFGDGNIVIEGSLALLDSLANDIKRLVAGRRSAQIMSLLNDFDLPSEMVEAIATRLAPGMKEFT